MEFKEEYLKRLIQLEVAGDFPPYNSGNMNHTDDYIQQIILKLKAIPELIVTTEAESYGSGFASYSHISISKKDKSDTIIQIEGNFAKEDTRGLLLYICRLAPYAVYAPGEWGYSFEDGRPVDGTYCTMETKKIGTLPEGDWAVEIQKITSCLDEFQITILNKDQLIQPLSFEATIPTMLSDPPYKVLDCFFYWEE
jgi:hypothetical protein